MKCYYHQSGDAVGLCKACSKGICHECAVDVGGGLACAATCVDAVRGINALVAGNTTKVALRLRGSYFWSVLLGAFGVVFILAPVLSGRPMSRVATVVGVVFCIFGIVLALYQRAFNKAFRESAQRVVTRDRPKTGVG